MLTVWGVVLTVAGAAGIGVCLCQEYRYRAGELFLLEKAFWLAAGEVSYARTGIPQLFRAVGERLNGALGNVFCDMSRLLEDGSGQSLDKIWRQKMEPYLHMTHLNNEEIRYILAFPEAIGFLDGERQREAMERYAKEMGRLGEEVRSQLAQKQRSIMAMAVSGGIMAAVLLL